MFCAIGVWLQDKRSQQKLGEPRDPLNKVTQLADRLSLESEARGWIPRICRHSRTLLHPQVPAGSTATVGGDGGELPLQPIFCWEPRGASASSSKRVYSSRCVLQRRNRTIGVKNCTCVFTGKTKSQKGSVIWVQPGGARNSPASGKDSRVLNRCKMQKSVGMAIKITPVAVKVTRLGNITEVHRDSGEEHTQL